MQLLPTSINDNVTVTLTKAGADYFNKTRRETREKWLALREDRNPLPLPEEVGAGHKVETQLWILMRDFGPAMLLCADPLFEGNAIFIEAQDATLTPPQSICRRTRVG